MVVPTPTPSHAPLAPSVPSTDLTPLAPIAVMTHLCPSRASYHPKPMSPVTDPSVGSDLVPPASACAPAPFTTYMSSVMAHMQHITLVAQPPLTASMPLVTTPTSPVVTLPSMALRHPLGRCPTASPHPWPTSWPRPHPLPMRFAPGSHRALTPLLTHPDMPSSPRTTAHPSPRVRTQPAPLPPTALTLSHSVYVE